MLWERIPPEVAGSEFAVAAAALSHDPRRLVAVVGDGTPVVAARRLAATFPVALARDRLATAGDGLAEFRAALVAAGDGPAAVVLDGPDDVDALALLPALVAHGLQPGLRVIVPCDRSRAGRLAFAAGGQPRASIAVVAVTEPAATLPSQEFDLELLPLVLVGRLAAGRLDGESSFVQRGLAEHHAPSGDIVCLLGVDARAAVARRALATSPDAADSAVRAVLAAAPTQRARLLCGLAATGYVPDDTLADELCAFEAAELPAPFDWIRRGTPLPAWALRAIARRAERLGAGFATRAWIAKLAGGPAEEGLELIESGLAVTENPTLLAELALLRAAWSGAPDAAEQALACARAAGPEALRAALGQRAAVREAGAELEGALEDALELEELAVADDDLGGAAAAALAVARLCEALRRPDEAAAAAERAAAHHGAIGDPARAAFAWLRAARLHASTGARAAAGTAAAAACALGECTGDARLVGYARWFLGALAERDADPATAAGEYAKSLDAYAMLGAVPDRLLPSLERARAAAAGRARQLPGDGSAEVQIPEDAALADALLPAAEV